MDRQAQEPPRGPVPSRAAARRLRDGLRREVDEYRETLAEDLVDAHLWAEQGDHDRAIATLESHLASLEQLQTQVQRVVAGAMVERDAEDVVDRAVRPLPQDVPPPPPPIPGVIDVREDPSGDDRDMEPAVGGTAVGGSLRRGIVAAVAVAAIAFVGLGPLQSPQPDPLLAAVQASEFALAAAEAAESGQASDVRVLTARSASLHDAIDSLPADVRNEPEVRSWLRMVITDQHAALTVLVGTVPTVDVLLADLGRLAADLDIPLPALPEAPISPDMPDLDDVDPSTDGGQAAEPAPRPGHGPTTDQPATTGSGQDRSEPAPTTASTSPPAAADPEPTPSETAGEDFLLPPVDLDGGDEDQGDGFETDFGDADGLGSMSAG